jgi:general secretion pathway protein K
VALLTAILLVALGTILATALAYQTAMTARRGQGDFAMDQSILIAEAGEAIAGYALRESFANGNQQSVDMTQPWAMPFGPVEVTPGVTLEASLEDLQGRFNLNDLVGTDGKKDLQAIQAFRKLLSIIGLEPKWADLMADWIDADTQVDTPDGAEDSAYLSQMPPYRPADRQITSASALLALPGFGPDRYAKLAPYVTALPSSSQPDVNLCTANAFVLDALLPNDERQYSTDPTELEDQRKMNGCFPTKQVFQQPFVNDPQFATSYGKTHSGQQSTYFRLTSIVTIGNAQFYLYSLLYWEPNTHRVRVIQRSFTAD